MPRVELIEMIIEWEQYKKANWTESETIDIEKKLMFEFATLKALSLPPVEGAEDYICEWCNKIYGGGKELEDWTSDEVMRFANDFAALYAQKIADKMVGERLIEELIVYDKWLWNEGEYADSADEHADIFIPMYLKSREHESK